MDIEHKHYARILHISSLSLLYDQVPLVYANQRKMYSKIDSLMIYFGLPGRAFN